MYFKLIQRKLLQCCLHSISERRQKQRRMSELVDSDTVNLSATNVSSQNTTIVLDPLYLVIGDGTKYAVTVFLSMSFAIGVPGNILVVLVHASTTPKSVTDWMIFYLAVCDLIYLLTAPLFITQFLDTWPQFAPDFLCKLLYFGGSLATVASYVFCACIAVERYIKVAGKQNIVMCLEKSVRYFWIPVVIFSTTVTSTKLATVSNNEKGHCSYEVDDTDLVVTEYVIMLSLASVTSLVMCVCYIATGVLLIKKKNEYLKSSLNTEAMATHKSLVKVTKTLAVVTAVFFITANLSQSSGLFISHGITQEPLLSISFFLRLLYFVNAFLNPFIYFFMYGKFKRRSKYIARKVLCLSPSAVAAEDT